MFDIICYGTICQDRIMRIMHFPALGSSTWIQDDRLTVGGEAANSCMALNAWGMRTLLLGTVLGRDERAEWLLERLGELEHVDISRLICSHQAQTPYCNIFATPDGERTMFGRHFDIMRGQPVEELPACRVFTLDPYCREMAIKAAVAARDAGFTIVAMDALRRPEIAACADLIVTSYQEANPKASDDELTDIACAAAQEHEADVVITLGARGSLAAGPGGRIIHRQSAVRVEQPVDATGCGDVYRAGLAAGVAMGWDLPRSMAFASAAAALNLLGMGGGGCALSLDETLAVAESGEIPARLLTSSSSSEEQASRASSPAPRLPRSLEGE